MPSVIVDEGKLGRQNFLPPKLRMIESTPSTFEEALQHVTRGKIIHQSLGPMLSSTIEGIEDHVLIHGLSRDQLKGLITAITSNSLDQPSQNALIKCLYPIKPVSPELVYNVVGSLGHGTLKASMPTQQGLLKWLTMIYDALEDVTALIRCYSVLFNLIDTTSLRADLCHLLSKITRKKHVKPFRIQLLKDLSRTVGQDLALQKLMHMYENYAPRSLDTGIISKRSPSSFAHPNPEWGARLEKIQEEIESRLGSVRVRQDLDGEKISGRETHSTPLTANEDKNTERLNDAVSDLSQPRNTELRLSDLESQTFLNRANLMPTEKLATEIDDLLTTVFEQQLKRLESGREATNSLYHTLDKTLAFTRNTKTHLTPTDLQTTILNPLENALLSTTTDSSAPQLVIQEFYTTLLTHWTSHLLSLNKPPTSTQKSTIISLTTHTSLLTLTILTTTPPTLSTTNTLLNHHLSHTPLLAPPLSLPLTPPTPLTIYLLLHTSPTLPTLSPLSTLLATYKLAFENPPAVRSPTEIKSLNATLIDTCNLLFRSRAFNTADSHALGCLIPSEVIAALAEYTQGLEPPQPLGAMFSLSHHAGLAALSIAAFREMEEERGREGDVSVRHAGPVTQRSLVVLSREGGVKIDWKQYRVAVLQWLEGMGVTGIKELGVATMKGLMADKDGAKAQQDKAPST